MRTDISVVPLPSKLPNFGGLLGINITQVDPDFGTTIIRATDNSINTAALQTADEAEAGIWSANDSFLLVRNNNGGTQVLSFNTGKFIDTGLPYALAPVQRLGAEGPVERHCVVLGIAQQGDPEPVLRAEPLMLGTAVGGDAEHLDAQGRVLVDEITELAGLFGAAGRVISRVEVDDDPAARVVAEPDDRTVLIGQGERRGRVALDQCCHTYMIASRAMNLARGYRQ